VIDQRQAAATRAEFGEQRLDEVDEVVDLLQLAPAVLVELAVAGQDVQFLEQFDRLLRPDFGDRRQAVFLTLMGTRDAILAPCRRLWRADRQAAAACQAEAVG
jgi:hypothetical protein